MPNLSEAALTLLRRRLSTKDSAVTSENLAAYRELAAAGIMVSGHTFVGGRESIFKFTEAGWAFANATWPAESAAHAG